MASRIEVLLRAALQTFSPKFSSNMNRNLNESLQHLRCLANEITLSDIGLVPNVSKLPYDSKSGIAPVTYMEIFENEYVSVGVFMLRDGVKLPLHDHEGMHGILKVLEGTLSIQSYTKVELTSNYENLIASKKLFNLSSITAAQKLPLKTISKLDMPAFLTPSERNIHEIKSLGGPASFLDILSPPYNVEGINGPKRDCHYFSDLDYLAKEPSRSDVHLLVEVPCPQTYWCDCAVYQGPNIQHLYREFK